MVATAPFLKHHFVVYSGHGQYQPYQIGQTAIEIASLTDEPENKEYLLSKTPAERLAALEIMRELVYGYDPTATRLQRVLEITQLPHAQSESCAGVGASGCVLRRHLDKSLYTCYNYLT